MLTLGIALLFNIILWSLVFFFLRRIQPAANVLRHAKSKISYSGKLTASPKTLLPLFCFFLVLIFVVFFSSPHLTTWTARGSGAGFVLISFLSYLFLLKSFVDRGDP